MKSLSIVIIAGLLAGCSESEGPRDYDLLIFHTNDRHSHFLGIPNAEYDPSTTGDGTCGGIARIATLIEEESAGHPDTLLFSAGDFTMGTLFVAAQNSAADLNFMSYMGYDAAALGNHEFDWGPQGLTRMISAAEQPLIPLLCANIEFSDSKPGDDDLEALYGAQGEPGKVIHPYIVQETANGTRVGVLGLMGEEAGGVSLAAPVKFSSSVEDMAETAQAVVDELRLEHEVDVVLALAHLGITIENDVEKFETIELAKLVDGIDIILSGHNHTSMEQAISVPCEVAGSSWSTLTMETGSYGRALGRYELRSQGGQKTASGRLIVVEDDTVGDSEATQKVEQLISDIENNVLTQWPQIPEPGAFLDGDFFQVLTHSRFDLPRNNYDASNLAYLLADAMREVCGTQFAAVSNGGDLRQSLNRVNGDEFVLADTFMVTPLGTGPDQRIGYPLVRAHLYLSEIKLALESSTCDQGTSNNDFMITLSGMRLLFDCDRPPFERIIKLTQYENLDESDPGTVLYDVDNGGFQVDEYQLYSICVSSYIANMFSQVGMFPRDAEGNPLRDQQQNSLIVKDDQDREVKLWYTFLGKLASFGGDVPDQYNDDEAVNPAGPYWRRSWDLCRHPE